VSLAFGNYFLLRYSAHLQRMNPFGATTASGAANRSVYRFIGREYFYRARSYSPSESTIQHG
jgi:hypothetical protein